MQDLVLSDEAHFLFVLTNDEIKISHNSMTFFESKVAQSAIVFNSESATFLARGYLPPLVCYMTIANMAQTQDSYSHTAIIDSGTNICIYYNKQRLQITPMRSHLQLQASQATQADLH